MSTLWGGVTDWIHYSCFFTSTKIDPKLIEIILRLVIIRLLFSPLFMFFLSFSKMDHGLYCVKKHCPPKGGWGGVVMLHGLFPQKCFLTLPLFNYRLLDWVCKLLVICIRGEWEVIFPNINDFTWDFIMAIL